MMDALADVFMKTDGGQQGSEMETAQKESDGFEAKEQIEQWRAETADTPLQSAQQVQNRLLDLYGSLRDYPVIGEVEKWLGLTRERSLFEGQEIVELLDEIETVLALEALGLEEPVQLG
jgi:hypothetical protein